MDKEFKIFNDYITVKYTESETKRQKLWDAFIKWCKDHNATSGESFQNDDLNLYAPEFMASAIDNICEFEIVED